MRTNRKDIGEQANGRQKKTYKKPTVEVVYYRIEKGFQTSSQPQPDEQEFLQTERFTEDSNNSGGNFWG